MTQNSADRLASIVQAFLDGLVPPVQYRDAYQTMFYEVSADLADTEAWELANELFSWCELYDPDPDAGDVSERQLREESARILNLLRRASGPQAQ